MQDLTLRACTRRYDHHSFYAFVWAWGSQAMYLVECFVRPLLGYGLVAAGQVADAYSVARERGLQLVNRWLGYLLEWLVHLLRWLGFAVGSAEESGWGVGGGRKKLE
jgi:hypothetical protein